jgi:aspartate carbamoyltransferase catalytic subunit
MKHLISVQELSREDTVRILDTAIELNRVTDGGTKILPTLRGRTVVNLFYEDSTRTRISFERAAKRLSADVVTFSAKGSSVSKGESLKDTALTLNAMGADMIVVRHPSPGAAHRLAHAGWLESSVLNAGDGKHEHPTQALGDAFTLRAHLCPGAKDFAGLTIGIVGDVLHSRVGNSWCQSCSDRPTHLIACRH